MSKKKNLLKVTSILFILLVFVYIYHHEFRVYNFQINEISATTKIPFETANIPSVTTKIPSVTTKIPSVTTKIPSVTTKIPSVTTKIPSVTTKIPSVTTKIPNSEIESEFKSFKQCQNSTGENIRNFYLIKSYKAASSTLSNLLYRYGLKHGLSFVEPQDNTTNQIFPFSHLDTATRFPLIPSCDNIYNLSTIHCRFEGKEKLEKTMPVGTIIFASVRNPISQLQSSFNYLRFGDKLKKKGITFNRFIENPLKISRLYLGFPKERIILNKPKNLVFWNQQSQVFGLYDFKIPVGIGRKEILGNEIYEKQIMKFLERVDKEVDFVFIAEHFMESIAIFREMFGLGYSDVAHFNINFSKKNNNVNELTKQQQDKIIEFNYIDWLLYQRMVDKFEKINSTLRYDLSFEIDAIQRLNARIAKYCLKPNQYRTVQGEFCKMRLLDISETGKKDVCCQRIVVQEWKLNKILKTEMRDTFLKC